MIPHLRVLVRQARQLRSDTPILPEAAQPWSGGSGSTRLLLVGDSTIAGVGVHTQALGLAGQLGNLLGASWVASGLSGATSRTVLKSYLVTGEFDVIVVSAGANDALAVRSRGAYARDIRSILRFLRAQSPNAAIIVSSMPGFAQFSLLPEPLRGLLARHSIALETAARGVVASFDRVAMTAPAPTYTPGFFASDNFHPGEIGYRDWARFIVDDPAVKELL
jgi:lysophospholipase L1-like esterase